MVGWPCNCHSRALLLHPAALPGDAGGGEDSEGGGPQKAPSPPDPDTGSPQGQLTLSTARKQPSNLCARTRLVLGGSCRGR